MSRQVARKGWLNGWHVLITDTRTENDFCNAEVIRSCSLAELQLTTSELVSV